MDDDAVESQHTSYHMQQEAGSPTALRHASGERKLAEIRALVSSALVLVGCFQGGQDGKDRHQKNL